MPATLIDEEDIPDQETLELQKSWLADVNIMLEGYKKYTPNEAMIKKFLNERLDFQLYSMYGYQLIWDIMRIFQAGVTQRKKELCKDYLRIIKKTYMMMSERNKLVFHNKFIEEWQHHDIDYCPYFESLITDFSDNLNCLLAELEKDTDNINVDLKDEIRFCIMISPVTTILRIWARATRSHQVIKFAVDICHEVPSLFFDKELSIWHTEYEVDQKEPILPLIIRRLIFNSRLEEPAEQQYEAIEVLAAAVVKGDTPLLSPWILLDMVFCELFTDNRIPTKSLEALTGIASRVLSPKNNYPFDWKFANSIRTQPTKKVYLVPSILVMVLDMMNEYHENKRSFDILENCKAILQCLGNRMREENEEFDEETKDYLRNKIMEMPWWIEYALSTWFWALDVQRRRIPSVIFHAIQEAEDLEEKKVAVKEEEDVSSGSLSSNDRETVIEYPVHNTDSEVRIPLKFADKYEPIEDHLSNKRICREELYIRSIMELGLFDVECALELLHQKTLIKFNNPTELYTYMETTMHDCFGVTLGHTGKEDTRVLFMEILEVFEIEAKYESHEDIAMQLLSRVRNPTIIDSSPLWTEAIKPTKIIPAIVHPMRHIDKSDWPPEDSSFVKVHRQEVRREQKQDRERLLDKALKKSKAVAQHHRNTWAEREARSAWICPQSPPNEPSSLGSGGSSQSSVRSVYSTRSLPTMRHFDNHCCSFSI
uniref:SOSS complex subunit A homolog n=1 Tax=Caenorhabditis tropicalis TaxID=1561998 RepID=A0A1I7UZI3_9PELO